MFVLLLHVLCARLLASGARCARESIVAGTSRAGPAERQRVIVAALGGPELPGFLEKFDQAFVMYPGDRVDSGIIRRPNLAERPKPRSTPDGYAMAVLLYGSSQTHLGTLMCIPPAEAV